MPIPLKKLIDFRSNIYELVTAVIKRSQQITEIRSAYNPTTLEEQTAESTHQRHEQFGEEKATSVAFQEIFDEKVIYKRKITHDF